ncbi:MAG: polysaccharide biosynthesis tyrosine autokinase [Pseudomonadota bacterium]|nr:polysaccharide biosynthesis tyrosine autokinase [Pseudomonadota bacterium]
MNELVPAYSTNLELERIDVPRRELSATRLEQIGAAVYRQRKLGLAIFAAVMLLGLIATLLADRRYTAVASVQLEQQAPRVIADPDLDPQASPADSDRFLQTQLDLVRSRSLAESVAGKLQDRTAATAEALGVEGDTPGEQKESLIASLQANVQAKLGLNTRIAQIEFTSFDPQVSAKVANAYADALAGANLQTKISTAEKAKQYLTGQLSAAKSRLEGSERRMLAYARSADLTATIAAQSKDTEHLGSLRAQQVALLNNSLSDATARRIDAQQQWAQVSGTSALLLPDVQNNAAVQDLASQKAQLEAKLQEDRQRYTDNYPTVRETAARIRQLDGAIASLANNIKASFRGRYQAAAQQEQQLQSTVAGLRGAAMAERERAVGFNTLQREVETNRAFYDGLLQRYKEVAAASGAPSANVTVIDRAAPPLVPSSPNVLKNMALATVAGLLLALFVGSAREGMQQLVRSPEEMELAFNLPTLGVIPFEAGQTHTDFRLKSWRSTQAEAYHSIAVALEQAAGGVLPKTLLITSSSASEGKSTTAVGIARSITAMGRAALLIDGDLRHPSLREFFGPDERPGFAEILRGVATAPQTIQQNEENGFDIVPAGQMLSTPFSLLASQHMQEALRQLSEKYDTVIIDGPPILGLADAVLLARSVEAVLVVVEANRLHRSEIEIALSRLPGSGIIGTVVTKFNPKSAGVRYGGTDYYSY